MTEYIAQLEASGAWYPVVSFNGLYITLCKKIDEPDNSFDEYLIDIIQIRHTLDINSCKL